MIRAQLHLVGSRGLPVSTKLQDAVESAFRWTVRAFPNVDSALIADWAEEVALAMEAIVGELHTPGRYAAAALNGKVRDWLKTGPAKLEAAGVGVELERLGGVDPAATSALDGKRLLEQIQVTLSDRDQLILMLLTDDSTDSEIAQALRLSDTAARKAIQRFRDRIASQLGITRRTKGHPGRRSKTFETDRGEI